MISGRGLGHTGGTLDKFDSIPGYNTQPNLDMFKKVVKEVGCAIIGQTSNLAPADKKLYSIRDIVGTVESLPLITSSILSKKIASGLKSLILDVKVGNGSFNSTIEISRELSQSLVSVAKGAGLKCEAIITDMNQVLGKSAGHTLEMLECIKYLKNEIKDYRLEKITNELISSLLMMVYKISKEDCRSVKLGSRKLTFCQATHFRKNPGMYLGKEISSLVGITPSWDDKDKITLAAPVDLCFKGSVIDGRIGDPIKLNVITNNKSKIAPYFIISPKPDMTSSSGNVFRRF